MRPSKEETNNIESGPFMADPDLRTFMDGSMADISGYIAAQKRYLMLHVSKRSGVLLGNAVHLMALLAGLAFALLLLGVALALFLGEQFTSYPLGFLIVAVTALIALGIFQAWWTSVGKDAFTLARINDLHDEETDVP